MEGGLCKKSIKLIKMEKQLELATETIKLEWNKNTLWAHNEIKMWKNIHDYFEFTRDVWSSSIPKHMLFFLKQV